MPQVHAPIKKACKALIKTKTMGQSLSQLYVHLAFGTKERYPFIPGQIELQLHSYIGGILKNKESPALNG